jgi:GNAT superfamily N-acetyltransferase
MLTNDLPQPVSTIGLAARDLRCLLRERGPKAALGEIGCIARRPFYTTADEIIVRKELASAEPAATGTVRVEGAESHHVPLLAEFNRRQCNTRRTRRFETDLAEGKRALLGFRDGKLIGYFWWHDAAQAGDCIHLTRAGLSLADDEVYGYMLYIAPEQRGQGTPAEFLAGVEAALARLGFRRMFGFVDSSNRRARWLYATSGYEDVVRCQTRTFLRRLMLVDGRKWRLSGKNGLRPLPGIGSTGPRRLKT